MASPICRCSTRWRWKWVLRSGPRVSRWTMAALPAPSRADATAAALALGLSVPVRLLTAGAMPDTVARDYLALGAPLLEILEAEADVLATLLPALRDVPWVLTGTRSEAEHGTGLLP